MKEIVLSDKPIELGKPAEVVKFASVLKQFIVDQSLYTNIQGNNYVNVEGWQFAGASMGILPFVRKLERLEGPDTAYRCEVILKKDKEVVGSGVAICSTKEPGRGNQAEYIIASMAQTRAIGKAYRNTLAWVMKLAGYAPTPAEEMTGI
jgi:hypothetical protein